MKVFVGILALFVCSVTALEFDRPCRDNVEAKINFSPAFFTGTWFEIYNSFDQGVECLTHHYTRRGIQQVFDVERVGALNDEFYTENGIVEVVDPDEVPMRAIFNATMDRINVGEVQYYYRIVATDYTNYAVIWSCSELPNDRSVEEGAVIGRGTTLDEASYTKIRAILEGVDLNLDDFRTIQHTPEACLLTEPERA